MNKILPTDVEINMFLLKECKLDIVDILKVSNLRNRQEAWVSFKNEALANDFESQLLNGIEWGTSGLIVFGKRLDRPSLYIKLRGVADDIEDVKIVEVMSRYGNVISCTRGTAPMARKFQPEDDRWVWDGVWHVQLKVADGTTVPSKDPSFVLQQRHPLKKCLHNFKPNPNQQIYMFTIASLRFFFP